MQLPPLSVIESWPTANYIDPVTRGPADFITTLLFFIIALIIVCLRMYTRLRIAKSFGWDDGLIVAAMLPATAFAIVALLTINEFAWDRHIWDVPFNLIEAGLKLSIINEILFSLATNLTKLSMLAMTYRIVSQGTGYLSKLIIGAMGLIIAQGTLFVFMVLFQCGKPSNYWQLTFLPQEGCISETDNLLAAGIVNSITDLLVVILPMPMVYSLRLPLKQQITVGLLFGVGFLITCVGVVRTYFLYQTTIMWDKTWLAYDVYICSSVELYIGIICASVPATKKFFNSLRPDQTLKLSQTQSSSPSNHTHTTSPSLATQSAKLDSITIGTYPADFPLYNYGVQPRRYTTIPPQPKSRDQRQDRHTLTTLPSVSLAKARPESSDSDGLGTEKGYEISTTESDDGLVPESPILPLSPMPPLRTTRPPPTYRQST